MSKERITVGLEIGTSKVCAVVGEWGKDAPLRILGVGEAPSRGVRRGEIVDVGICSRSVRDALVDAEDKSEVRIRNVCLGVTGAHIQGFNSRGTCTLPHDREQIEQEDVAQVFKAVRENPIPAQNVFLHTIVQDFAVDGHGAILNPLGMHGRTLEAECHIIHGIASRIKESIRCVTEAGIGVLDVVFNPLAASEVILGHSQKNGGTLVVDMGAGTTDYIVHADGAVRQSGTLGIGGDFITMDISLGLRIPTGMAERLKIEKLDKGIGRKYSAGVVLTGGGSALRGCAHLAGEIFQIPVQIRGAQNIAGTASAFENPKYSTAIGLAHYR